MDRVESLTLFPGHCAVCRSASTPQVDTGAISPLDERIYVCEMCARGIAGAFDFVPREALVALEARIAEQDVELEELRELEATLNELRKSVRHTLVNGAVIEQRGEEKGSPRLRPVPGRKAVEV